MFAESTPVPPSRVEARAQAALADDARVHIGDVDAPDRDRQRAWLEVDLDALVRNAAQVRAHAGRALLPMVKAEAYGLGAVPVARALEALDPYAFGVASVAEGEGLRAAGITRRIVLFTPILASELPRAARAGMTPSLHRADDVARWAALGGGAWQLAIDTGMSRAGARWDEIDALADAVRAHPPEGAYTHFHSADTDHASRAEQEARFDAALARLPARPPVVHAENSPGLEHGPRGSRWDVVRPGVFLYGVTTGGALAPEPVAHLRARIVDVRRVAAGETVSYAGTWRAESPGWIATVAAGYADGYRRHLSNRGVALLRGAPVPVAGNVTMDMTMLDVTSTGGAMVGDVVTLLGRDEGAVLTVDDVAARGGLSPYELLTGLRLRVPPLYLGGG